jgi:hypothetical protein
MDKSMSGMLKVLQKIEDSQTRSLQVDVPEELLNGLNIQEDGTVDLEGLMQLCQRLIRLEKMKTQLKKAQETLPEAWRTTIFSSE